MQNDFTLAPRVIHLDNFQFRIKTAHLFVFRDSILDI